MPTTNLSKRAEAIIKNSATLKIQKPFQPASSLGKLDGTQRPSVLRKSQRRHAQTTRNGNSAAYEECHYISDVPPLR